MNPFIKKQFYTELWSYNNSLDKPFNIYYDSPVLGSGYSNYLRFEEKEQNEINYAKKERDYIIIIENNIEQERINPNARKLSVVGNEIVAPYFKYFFMTHPDLQLDLLKFFNNLLSYPHKPLEFLKTLEKENVAPLIVKFNQWLPYSTQNLNSLQDLMTHLNFENGFRVNIFKNYVKHNLKIINKNPSLSKDLELFTYDNYSDYASIITESVVSIKKRKEEVNEKEYFNSFLKEKTYALIEKINTENILNTFQIAGWQASQYNRLICSYHDYIKNKHNLEINYVTTKNDKIMDVVIKMKNEDFTLEHYQKDLFILFSFCRNNYNTLPTQDMISQIFLNYQLNENLDNKTTRTKSKKI